MAYTENKSALNLETKATPIDADVLILGDSADSGRAKGLLLSDFKANGDISSNSLYRQAIINGNFDVWQRGTSFTNLDSIFSADRWGFYSNTITTAGTVSQQVAGLYGSQYCLKYQRTNTEVDTSPSYLVYSMETKDSIKLRGSKVTLSFYAKCGANFSSVSSNLSVVMETGTGIDENEANGYTGVANIISGSAVLTTSWQKFTFTTSNVIANTVNEIGINISSAPTGTAGADDSFYITQVQLNAGSVALPFMPKSYAEELRNCQRYAVAITTVSTTEEVAQGHAVSTTVSYPSITLPVTMRTLPTVTATAGDWQLDDGINTPTDVSALVIDDLGFSNTRKIVLKASAASGLTAYRPYYLVGDGSASRVLILNAEL